MLVTLQEWTLDRREDLIRICNEVDRSYLAERLPYPYTEGDAAWWLGRVAEQEGKEGVFRAILADGKVVGNISVERKSDVYCRDGELGYLLTPAYAGMGIMTEAVRKMCEVAYTELDLLRMTALVYAPNIASIRVLEKNGFLQEGFMKRAVYKKGKVYDLCIFGRLREEEGKG